MESSVAQHDRGRMAVAGDGAMAGWQAEDDAPLRLRLGRAVSCQGQLVEVGEASTERRASQSGAGGTGQMRQMGQDRWTGQMEWGTAASETWREYLRALQTIRRQSRRLVAVGRICIASSFAVAVGCSSMFAELPNRSSHTDTARTGDGDTGLQG